MTTDETKLWEFKFNDLLRNFAKFKTKEYMTEALDFFEHMLAKEDNYVARRYFGKNVSETILAYMSTPTDLEFGYRIDIPDEIRKDYWDDREFVYRMLFQFMAYVHKKTECPSEYLQDANKRLVVVERFLQSK